jgi:hypothetical protein
MPLRIRAKAVKSTVPEKMRSHDNIATKNIGGVSEQTIIDYVKKENNR